MFCIGFRQWCGSSSPTNRNPTSYLNSVVGFSKTSLRVVWSEGKFFYPNNQRKNLSSCGKDLNEF